MARAGTVGALFHPLVGPRWGATPVKTYGNVPVNGQHSGQAERSMPA